MSAWMVSDRQIAVIVNKAIELGYFPEREACLWGQRFVDENVRSLVARYGEQEQAENAHDYRDFPHLKVDNLQAYKYVLCLDYQSCEHTGWETSKPYDLLQSMLAALELRIGSTREKITGSKEYRDCKWDIDG